MQLPVCLNEPLDGLPWAPPLDVEDVVVRLETAGVTDEVAQADYGFSDRWDLAEHCLRRLQNRPAVIKSAPKESPLWVEYLRGFSFALPLLLCSAAMIAFQYSLWGGDVSAEMAVAVGLGTVTSFVTTGGIVQALARRCLFLLSVDRKEMGEACCWWWIRLGIAVLVVSAVGLMCASRYFQWLPPELTWVFGAFHVSLGLLWLAAGILHMLERGLWIVSATAIGIVAVVALHLGGHIPLAQAQIVGILLTAGCAFLSGARFLRAPSTQAHPTTARLGRDLVFVWPHFVFGSLYYLFLFADRLLAWTRPELAASSTVVFRGAYETALDIALVSFVLQVGWVRYAIMGLFRGLSTAQKTYRVPDREQFCQAMQRRYLITSLQLIPLAAAVSVLVYSGAQRYLSVGDPGVQFTLRWALAAMPFLVIGLWNTNLQFRLGCVREPLVAIGIGLTMDIIDGYLLSRLGVYEYAVCGFTMGAIAFAAAGTFASVKILRSADYFHFASAL